MSDKKRFYGLWIAIAFLFCLNLGTIAWILIRSRQQHNTRITQEAILVRKLDFTLEQRAQYRFYRKQLRSALQPHEDSLFSLRSELFGRVNRTTLNQQEVDRLIRLIGHQTSAITRLRFRHWQQVRQLCSPDQQARFDQVINHLFQQKNRTMRKRFRNRL